MRIEGTGGTNFDMGMDGVGAELDPARAGVFVDGVDAQAQPATRTTVECPPGTVPTSTRTGPRTMDVTCEPPPKAPKKPRPRDPDEAPILP
jgi:hypothetical protein